MFATITIDGIWTFIMDHLAHIPLLEIGVSDLDQDIGVD